MTKPKFDNNWPDLWKECFEYDCLEFFGSQENHGYRYAFQKRFSQVIEWVKEFLPRGARILDMAAAQGNFSITLAELGYNVTWNDLRTQLIDYVKLKYEYGNLNFAPGNAFDIDATEPFDGVIITEIIEHVAHPDQFLQRVASLVRPGGFIFMTTPLGNYFLNKLPRFSDTIDRAKYESVQFKPNSDGHIFLLHKDEISQLAEATRLKIKKIAVYNNSLTSGHAKLHYLLRVLPVAAVNYFERITERLPEKIKLKIHTNIGVVFEKN